MADKYSADELKAMAEKGHAMTNDDGSVSYPIGDKEDLGKAIHAVGRGGADHDKIRKHIIDRAAALKLSDMIPANWNAGGSLKAGESKQASPLLEWRRKKAASLSGLERRTYPASGLEIRESDDGRTLTLHGYASVTDTPYDMGFYTERIARGAFRRTLGENPDVQLLINHEGLPLARTRSNTLRLAEDQRGLKVEADLDPDDPDVRSLVPKMRRGDIDQMSFAFQATDQDWNTDWTDRTIKSASIHRGDVSVVNMGANELATAAVRSIEIAGWLRQVGPDGMIAALVEWRDWTLQPAEARDGKTLSGASMEVLTKVLALVQRADDATDEAIPMLAALMGVPNPDADDGTAKPAKAAAGSSGDGEEDTSGDDAGGDAPSGGRRDLQAAARRERERLAVLAAGGAR